MGRKIPGKKHRGVKDPIVQQEKRLARIKQKINTPPTNPDEQHIPKSLQRIIELTRKIKDGTISIKRKRKHKKKDGLIVVAPPKDFQNVKSKKIIREKPTPIFAQKPGEDDRRFLNRVNNIVQSVLVENEFEQKYGVDVYRNPVTGEVDHVEKKPKNEVDEMLDKVRKEAGQKKKKTKVSSEPRLTKAQKRKMKMEKRKQNKLESKSDEFSKFKDEVKFGDIVHGPPTLQLPKKATKNKTPRPGTKDLILKSVLQVNNNNSTKNIKTEETNNLKLTKKTTGSINKKGKRKDLPVATRRQLEQHRDEAVKAYKLLKMKQIN